MHDYIINIIINHNEWNDMIRHNNAGYEMTNLSNCRDQ